MCSPASGGDRAIQTDGVALECGSPPEPAGKAMDTRAVADGDLWHFAIALYGRPGVAEACLRLQDGLGVDVPVLLFAAWTGERLGMELSAAVVGEVVALARPWQREIIAPLRAVRRRLKDDPSPAPREAAEELRGGIKSLELRAEQLELAALEAFAGRLAAGGAADGAYGIGNMRAVAAAYAARRPTEEALGWIETIAAAFPKRG
jgi:uncharacterized protein (TIGR02444 family)